MVGALEDPRIDRTKRHKLLDIVTIAHCGTICGADFWVDIELFGKCKEEWFRTFLELPNSRVEVRGMVGARGRALRPCLNHKPSLSKWC